MTTCALACGGAAPDPATATPAPRPTEAPPPAAASAAPAADAAPEPAEAKALPTACAPDGAEGLCLPPADFVKRLCSGFYPDVALAMFRKGTPWTRAYLSRNVEAWNASGGATSSDKLVFDEEILVLAYRAADTGGMVVSGASGGYDVLRWDGTCATLMGEEITRKPPPKAKHAPIAWKSLSEEVRAGLSADERIGRIAADRRSECKGVSMGAVSQKCVKLDAALGTAIVEHVRAGGDLPAPAKLP